MMLEAVDLVAEALADGTYGVNAQLAALTSNSLITTGDDQPPDVTVKAETRDDQLSLGQIPATGFPLLLVTVFEEIPVQGEVATVFRDTTQGLTLQIAHVDENSSPAAARRNAYYTTRAILRCLRALAKNENITDRQRSSISLGRISRLVLVPMSQQVEEAKALVSSAVRVTFDTRDEAP